ncbi:MAG: SDR family oxidoreductase [Flavonifractor plautii]
MEKVISTDQNSVYFMMKEVSTHGAGRPGLHRQHLLHRRHPLNAGISYTAAKMAVIGMTKNVAIQYAGTGIRCNAVCPGPTETPISPQRTPPPLTRSSHGRAPATSTAQFPHSLRTKPTPFCFSPVTSQAVNGETLV